MDVSGLGGVRGIVPLPSVSPAPATRPDAVPVPSTPRDELSISSAARMLDRPAPSNSLRQERIARIKAEIESGVYDTNDKLEAALERMFDVLGLDGNVSQE